MGELIGTNFMISQNKFEFWAYVKICGYQLFIFLEKNTIVDFMCRSLNENTEWQPSPTIFKEIVITFKMHHKLTYFHHISANKSKTVSFGFLTLKQ